MSKFNTYDNYKFLSNESNNSDQYNHSSLLYDKETSTSLISRMADDMNIKIMEGFDNNYSVSNKSNTSDLVDDIITNPDTDPDPYTDTDTDTDTEKKSNIINEIPDMTEISDYIVNPKTSISKKSSSRMKSRDVFKTFKPLDSIIINPTIDLFGPLFDILKFKSKTIGFIVLLSYCLGLYFIYHSKENLVWLFLFFGMFTSYFDEIHYVNCSKKISQIKKSFNTGTKTKTNPNPNPNLNPTNYKKLSNILNYEHKQMQTILIKIVIFIILFGLFKSNMINTDKSNTYFYILILMSIITIILEFHTKNKIKKSRIAKTKKSHNILDNILIVRKICLCILLLVSAYLFSKNTIITDNKKTNNLLNVFLLNENDP